jgi:phage-related protein (TIGR01555 family)
LIFDRIKGMPRGGDRKSAAYKVANGIPLEAEEVKPERPPRWDWAALENLVERSQARARNRPRTRDWCPFPTTDQLKLLHPPTATPRNPALTMAMDQNLVANNDWCASGWMAGGILSSVASEGLLFLGYPYLSELAQRPEFRVISETIATEMTRKWIRIKARGDKKKRKKGGGEEDQAEDADPDENRTGDNDKAERVLELTEFLEDLRVRDRFMISALHDGFFGRSHLFCDTGAEGDELKTPIGTGRDETTKIKATKGFLKRLKNIEPIWTYPTTYNAVNPLKDDWYNPQIWYVMGQEIHWTRLRTFIGRPVPDILKPAYSFGGLSLSQMAKPYVEIWLQTRQSVAEIVHSFSVMVLYTNLATLLQGAGSGIAGDVLARAAGFNSMRDNQGLFVVDKSTEDFKNISAPISGLHELQAQSQEHMMSVARIPATKFTGMQPSGMNASAEGEMKAFYESIHAYQPVLFGENLDFVIDLAMISLWGEIDEDIVFEWIPLHSLSEKEEAEVRKLEAETGQILVDSGIVSQEEERERIAADPKTLYPGIDPDDVPDLLEEEAAGLEPVGGRPQPAQEAELGEGGGKNVVPFGKDASLDDLEAALAPAPLEPPPAPAPPEPTPEPKATPAELEKAKKSVPLKIQYLSGASSLTGAAAETTQKLINGFNSQWEGKENLSPDQLEQKVAGYKALGTFVSAMLAKQNEVAEAAANLLDEGD